MLYMLWYISPEYKWCGWCLQPSGVSVESEHSSPWQNKWCAKQVIIIIIFLTEVWKQSSSEYFIARGIVLHLGSRACWCCGELCHRAEVKIPRAALEFIYNALQDKTLQMWWLPPEHWRKGAHPHLGSYHSRARPHEIDVTELCFKSAPSWLAYFCWGAEGQRSTAKWKQPQVHKEEAVHPRLFSDYDQSRF